METRLKIFRPDFSIDLSLPYADGGVKAGFPSPAQDYMMESIDLNHVLVHHQECTFYARVCGESMIGAGIYDGDLVVIDKSLEAHDGDYIVACVDGEFTLKRFKVDSSNQCAWLLPANPHFPAIKVTADNDFVIWGVVTSVIRQFRH